MPAAAEQGHNIAYRSSDFDLARIEIKVDHLDTFELTLVPMLQRVIEEERHESRQQQQTLQL